MMKFKASFAGLVLAMACAGDLRAAPGSSAGQSIGPNGQGAQSGAFAAIVAAATQTSAQASLGIGTAATYATGTSGATVPLLNGANTWSFGNTFSGLITANSGEQVNGALTVGNSTTQQFFYSNGPAGSNRAIIYETAGSRRINLYSNSTAESGNNVGSDLVLSLYADDGATVLGSWTWYRRSGGGVSIALPTVTYSGSDSGTIGFTKPLSWTDGFAGSTTSSANIVFHQFLSNDTVAGPSSGSGATVWKWQDTYGLVSSGPIDTGSRRFFQVVLNQSGPVTNNSNSLVRFYTTLQPQNFMNYDGGSVATPESLNTNMNVSAGATNINGVIDIEQDIATYSGSTFGVEIGHAVYLSGSSGSQGLGLSTFENYATTVTNATDNPSSNTTPTLRNLFLIGKGGSQWPLDSNDSRLLYIFPQTQPNVGGSGNYALKPQQGWRGFDLTNVNFSDCAWCSPGFRIDGVGNTQIGRLQITDGASGPQISAAGYVAGTPTISNAGSGYIAGEWVYTGIPTYYSSTVRVSAPGTGYTSAPTVTFSDGTTATSTINSSGGVSAVIVSSAVKDTTSTPPTITFSGGGGSGATATANAAQANNDTGVYSGLGGILSIDTVNGSGVPQTVHWIAAPYSMSPPTNPIPLYFGGSGTNTLSVNVTWTQGSAIAFNSEMLMNSTTALATNTTTGFLHLPYVAAAPTGTPANTTGAPCVWNRGTHDLDCYDGGNSTWYHFVGVSGAL